MRQVRLDEAHVSVFLPLTLAQSPRPLPRDLQIETSRLTLEALHQQKYFGVHLQRAASEWKYPAKTTQTVPLFLVASAWTTYLVHSSRRFEDVHTACANSAPLLTSNRGSDSIAIL
jgi:hypothetical protein